LNTEENKPNIIVTLVTDIVLLLIVLIGLLRLLRNSGGSFSLGRLLWKQVRAVHFYCDALNLLGCSRFARVLFGS